MLKQVIPVVPVSDVDSTVRFFVEMLGFVCTFRRGNQAEVRRDAAAFRLVTALPSKNLSDPNSQMQCAVEVDDAEALYRALEMRLATLPAGHVRAPFDAGYGRREFHVSFGALLLAFGTTVR